MQSKYFHFLFSLVLPSSKTHVSSSIFSFLSLIRYYSIEWLSENPKRISPHWDHEISMERSKCLDRYFEDENDLRVVKVEFATFSGGRFHSLDVLTNRLALQPLV